jgi:copper chaperone CopZ
MDENCHVDPMQKQPSSEELARIEATSLAIQGMGCPNCAMRVRNSLLAVSGVSTAYVDHMMGSAKIQFNPSMASITELVQAVSDAGGDGRHEYFAQALPAG